MFCAFGDHHLKAVQNRLHRHDVSLNLLIERRMVRGFKNNLERPGFLLGRRGQNAVVAFLDDSIVRLEIVDAPVEIARKDAPGLLPTPAPERGA